MDYKDFAIMARFWLLSITDITWVDINDTGEGMNDEADSPIYEGGFEDYPATYVSWYGSTAFASYYVWRLPTEWQWRAVADYSLCFYKVLQ